MPFDQALEIIRKMEAEQKEVYSNYTSMLEAGVARELARSNLPLSLYTEWYWQIDLHNLFHFLRLRMDAHAQYEIRVYGEAMAKCAKAVAPLAYEAFEEHHLGSVTFSRGEAEALSRLLKIDTSRLDPDSTGLEGRALATFTEKLNKLQAAQAVEEPEEPVLPTV